MLTINNEHLGLLQRQQLHIRLIVETIIASHTSIAYHVEHIAEGMWPHHGLSVLISVEFAREV